MMTRSVNTQRSTLARTFNCASSTTPVPGLTTLIYLDVLAGGAVEHVAAKYGLRPHDAIERIEAARLCYDRQVNMPEFPAHLL